MIIKDIPWPDPKASVMKRSLFFVIIITLMQFLLIKYIHPYAYAKIIYKKYYEGLPDFEKSHPFSNQDQTIHIKLHETINKISIRDQICQKTSNDPEPYGAKKICVSEDVATLRSLIDKLAPSLNSNHMTFWLNKSNNERQLIIGYTISDEINKDPYFSIWLMRWQEYYYKAYYAGHFLGGSLHAIRQFGPLEDDWIIFIRFQSCTECCPWIYLIAIDFSVDPNGAAFQFTYSEDHASWHTTIEYILPGHGHSIDAEVETRIPTQVLRDGPHLIQHFKIEEGDEEWWVFNCIDFKCDYELYTDGLPKKYQLIWEKADKL